MLRIIREDLVNPDVEYINFPIINREYEKDLSHYILSTFQSISYALPEIQLTSHDFIIEVDKVNQGSYEKTRSDKKKDKEKKITYIQKSRLGELRMNFRVDMVWEGEHEPLEFTVKLLVPIPDNDGYMLLRGNKYILQYQLTESSTYTTSVAAILKSLLPISMKKDRQDVSINGDVLPMIFYKTEIFNKYENHLLFFFATKGFSNTLEYLQVGEYIKPVEEAIDNNPGYVYAKINNNLYLRVFEDVINNIYVQAVIAGIVNACNNRTTLADLENKDLWIEKIGAFRNTAKKSSHKELGNRFIVLFNRMLDKNTNDPLRLTAYNKGNIYKIIRWMMQNYNDIWDKDNLDITNKRLRCYELVGQMLNENISERIKRFVNTSANTKDKLITKYKQFFTFRGNEVISKLHSSGLMRFDDTVNDMDLFRKLKITSKGPNSGNKPDAKTVSMARRALDPSHLFAFDINFCSTSEPGLTNYLTLGCRTDGLYFEGAQPEPEGFSYEFANQMGKFEGGGIKVTDPTLYTLLLDALEEFQIGRFVEEEEYA